MTRDEFRTALETLPEVESVEQGIDTELMIRVTGEIAPPRVIGTIAAHGWGIMSVRQVSGASVMVDARPRAPGETDR